MHKRRAVEHRFSAHAQGMLQPKLALKVYRGGQLDCEGFIANGCDTFSVVVMEHWKSNEPHRNAAIPNTFQQHDLSMFAMIGAAASK